MCVDQASDFEELPTLAHVVGSRGAEGPTTSPCAIDCTLRGRSLCRPSPLSSFIGLQGESALPVLIYGSGGGHLYLISRLRESMTISM